MAERGRTNSGKKCVVHVTEIVAERARGGGTWGHGCVVVVIVGTVVRVVPKVRERGVLGKPSRGEARVLAFVRAQRRPESSHLEEATEVWWNGLTDCFSGRQGNKGNPTKKYRT